MIDKLKLYGIQLKKLGLTTFEGGFTTFGIYLRPQKIDVNFGGGRYFRGGALLSGGRYYRNFTVTFWISIFRELRTLDPRKHSTNRLIFVLQGGT